jgi:hypothetical protein
MHEENSMPRAKLINGMRTITEILARVEFFGKKENSRKFADRNSWIRLFFGFES